MKNPQTNITAILVAIVAAGSAAVALLDGNPSTIPDFAAVGAAIIGAIQLFRANDPNKG